MRVPVSLPLAIRLAACALAAFTLAQPVSAAEEYREPYRPRFHFTPRRNWMNDPNGLVYFEGEYHLFYQYNPLGDKWGHMSWGHAVSRDLVHWEHLPVALPEHDGVMAFSGSAVVDFQNTSGFGRDGKPPLVAIFTGHRDRHQDQRLAYSNDLGRTWTEYSGNPVIDINAADFRDPKVFWHEATKRWVMVVALSSEKKISIYASPDLKDWTHLSDFGPSGDTQGQWECPDLFPLGVESEPGAREWVMVVNVSGGAPAGGPGCQYFVGDFDGRAFTSSGGKSGKAGDTLWADYGRDFYAAVTWSNVPPADGRRILLGWMSNPQYAQDVPTSPWRSAMTVPRELALRHGQDGDRLVQKPVRELDALDQGSVSRFPGGTFQQAASWLAAQKDLPALLDVRMDFKGISGQTPFALTIQTAPDERTTIGFEPSRGSLYLDRSKSGLTNFHRAFSGRHEAPLRVVDGAVTLRMLIDTSSLELFVNDGETVLTELVFPTGDHRSLTLESDQGSGPGVASISIQPLKPSW